jgi:hypothetical protein
MAGLGAGCFKGNAMATDRHKNAIETDGTGSNRPQPSTSPSNGICRILPVQVPVYEFANEETEVMRAFFRKEEASD